MAETPALQAKMWSGLILFERLFGQRTIYSLPFAGKGQIAQIAKGSSHAEPGAKRAYHSGRAADGGGKAAAPLLAARGAGRRARGRAADQAGQAARRGPRHLPGRQRPL